MRHRIPPNPHRLDEPRNSRATVYLIRRAAKQPIKQSKQALRQRADRAAALPLPLG